MQVKKALAIVLSFALVLTFLPIGAFQVSAANASVSLLGMPYTYINEKPSIKRFMCISKWIQSQKLSRQHY